jgi:dihydrolipoamide dehydrogenase
MMTQNNQQFDVLIVGGGPGGYVAAIRAAQLGQKVALVEKESLGGICLNWGCIPTKALLRSADVLRLVKHSGEFGIEIDNSKIAPNLKAIIERSRNVAKKLNQGVTHLLKKNNVTVISGQASLQKNKEVQVKSADGKLATYAAKNIVLATGARARELPMFPVDGQTVWTYRHALTPAVLPKKMAIIGAGAIGVEFASFYLAMGVDVTLIEMASRILPQEDEEISSMMLTSLKKEGMKIEVGVSITSAQKAGVQWKIELQQQAQKKTIEADVVLTAAGIVGNTEGLGLENTRIRIDKTHVLTNEYCLTDEPSIYAIGDLAGAPWLAHKASHEGVLVAEHIAGKKPHPLNPLSIPACTYSHPQVASVGLSEAAAKSKGLAIKVGKFPLAANGKAIAMGATDGMVKVIMDQKTGELLGAHLIGEEVTEMIQGYTIAKTLETTEAELMATIFPHPTISESMHEAVLAAYTQAIHI